MIEAQRRKKRKTTNGRVRAGKEQELVAEIALSDRSANYSINARPKSFWTSTLSCEARNSIQVILSGGEILLESLAGNLLEEQKTILSKMILNAYRLNTLLSSLTTINPL